MSDINYDLIEKIPLIGGNNCSQRIDDEVFGIYDNPNGWCMPHNALIHFTVINKLKKNLLFLAIDKCCLDKTFAGNRCDFGLIDEETSFVLVEIKDTIKIKRKNKSTAVKQLENTIIHFDSLSIFDSTPNKVAIISWGFNPSKPAAKSSINSARLRFLTEYQFILLEGNEYEFN